MLTALIVAVMACGDGSAGDTATPTSSTSTAPAASDTASTTAADTASTTQGDLPGEPIEFGPPPGAVVAVIGVAHDDALNLRAGPGADQPIVAEIPPLADDLVARGETRDLGASSWVAVEHEGTAGWVNLAFIGFLGQTTDETAAVIDRLRERPRAAGLEDLGSTVAATFASEQPPSELVMTAAPTVGDLGEVRLDVVGLGDDAVAGYRVAVFAQPDGDTFVLRSVEVTTLCRRGVTEDGLCV